LPSAPSRHPAAPGLPALPLTASKIPSGTFSGYHYSDNPKSRTSTILITREKRCGVSAVSPSVSAVSVSALSASVSAVSVSAVSVSALSASVSAVSVSALSVSAVSASVSAVSVSGCGGYMRERRDQSSG